MRFTDDAQDAESAHAKQAKRTPTHCPHCGQDGSYGGLGKFTRSFTRHSTVNGEQSVTQVWAQMHCPECGNQFALMESEVAE